MPTKRNLQKLEKTVKEYLREIHSVHSQPDSSEQSFYPPLKILIEEASKILGKPADALPNPKKTEAGMPDFRIGTPGEIIGYIEAKSPDAHLAEIEESEQIQRYLTLPNLILTNFLQFRLYRNGKKIDEVEVARPYFLSGEYSAVPENIEKFSELLLEFLRFSIPAIGTSKVLSEVLATRTRLLEHFIQEELDAENPEVKNVYQAFQRQLIEDLEPERFADLYAQTISYGLFAAWMKAKAEFTKDSAWKFIPESLPLLRKIFSDLTGARAPESISGIADEIAQVLIKADISAILREFDFTRWQEDPVIQFYETFLANYNPKEKKRLGVYYTPVPVVSYIVRSVHQILKENFKKPEGLASRSVTLLDPAAGTLTFIVQAIKAVERELKERGDAGLIRSYIEEHILQNFYAFEILMAPYTIGHFKVAMTLEDMGYKFKEAERFKFYLTNTLEMKKPEEEFPLMPELAEEAEAALEVKEKIPILVVLGNPPYSVASENKSDFIENLMKTYKEDVRGERNIQPLSDDYIKFIRFGEWKISQAGRGILAFITNNSYLSGVIHRGMRRILLETFDEIYILNLHGSARIGEKTPEGGKDENVFAIQQGVAIAIYVKDGRPKEEKKILYADLWGLREDKYRYLFDNDAKTTKWQELKPIRPYFFFIPKDLSLQAEYEKFFKVSEIFKEYSSGVTTHRDHFVVGFTKDEIMQKLEVFTGSSPDSVVREGLRLKDTSTWKLSEARAKVKGKKLEDEIYPYAYRPLDRRHICYNSALIDRERRNLMKHIFKNNIALVTTKLLSKPPFRHVLVTQEMGDKCFISIKTKETAYFFPLYLYPEEGGLIEEAGPKRVSNFTDNFLKAMNESVGKTTTPDQMFAYIYAILHSPTYRKRYDEFLKIDFPRIPLPPNPETFKNLSSLGQKLIDLHLLKSPELTASVVDPRHPRSEIHFPESGSDIVEKVRYDEAAKSVYINKKQYFQGIAAEVWQYRIGAYQVLEKYLKDRRKRKLTLSEINHYKKMAKAVEMTMEVQSEIDKVYRSLKGQN